MLVKIPLTAGQPARQWFKAHSVVIDSTGAAADVQFVLFVGDQQKADDYGRRVKNFGVFDAARTFVGVELSADVDCVVTLLLSESRLDVLDGASVLATIAPAQVEQLAQEATLGALSAKVPAQVGGRVPVEAKQAGMTITQTVIAITAASQQLVSANAARKFLAWMVVGAADVTVAPGAAAAVAGAGMMYAAGAGANKPGGAQQFPTVPPTNAFQFIGSAAAGSLIVWEGV